MIEVDERARARTQLQACANYLNAHFAGLSLDAIRERLLELMREEKALYDSLLQKVVSVGSRAFDVPSDAADVYLDGASNMLDRPEFEDLGRMRALFKTFEEKSRLVRILNACLSDGLRVVHRPRDARPGPAGPGRWSPASYAVDGEKGWGLGRDGIDAHGVRSHRLAWSTMWRGSVAQALQEMHR